MNHERERITAYHEAGHAVVAYVMGEAVNSVSIIEDEESLGRAITPFDEERLIDEEDHEYMKRLLVGCYAGVKADKVLTGEEPELLGNDLSGAVELVIRLSATEEEQLVVSGRAADWAESLLRENWQKVRAVAEALLKHRELDAATVEQLLT
jgi:ATP-dependent Zn protease